MIFDRESWVVIVDLFGRERIIDLTVWGPPFVAVVVGVVLAGTWLYRTRPTDVDVAAARRTGAVRDMRSEAQVAVEAIKALELERDKLDPAEYERQRDELVERGARALAAEAGLADDADRLAAERAEGLRLINQWSQEARVAMGQEADPAPGGAPPGPPSPGTLDDQLLVTILKEMRQQAGPERFRALIDRVDPPGMSPEWKGALWALGGVAVAGGLYYGAMTTSRDREGNEPITGVEMARPNPQRDELRQQLEAALAANPKDLDALNKLTQVALSDGDLGAAQRYNQQAGEVDAANVDVRTYQAVLTGMIGMEDRALEYLAAILKDHPGNIRALTYQGLISISAGRGELAVSSLEQVIAVQGPHPALLQQLDVARSMVQGGGPMPAPVPAGPAESVVKGTVTLDPTLAAQWADAKVVFLSVADPARPRPPLAARQLSPTFPQEFEITTADAIAMGGAARPFPDELTLTLRLDRDGNATTKDDGAPIATMTLKKGSAGLQVELKAP